MKKSDKSVLSNETFLRDYIDCIASAGKQLDSREWWATHIASKNRFTSRMPHMLESGINSKTWRFAPSLWFDRFLHRSLQILRILAVSVKTLWHHIQARVYLRKNLQQMHHVASNPRYVIKTFIYDHSFSADNSYRDAFFGPLVQMLKEQGHQVLVYAVLLGNRKNCLLRMANCSEVEIIPVEVFLNFWDIINDMFRLLFTRFRPLKRVMFGKYNVASLLNFELARTLNDIPAYQYYHYRFVEALTKKVNIETFLQTGENNPWERMSIMALRKFSPETRILSYQHAVVPQSSANMFAGQGEAAFAPLPDHLLTTGPEPKKIIEDNGSYPDGFLVSTCGLRYGYLEHLQPKPFIATKQPRRILLALEGIPAVSKMVEYALCELSESQEYVVTIRAHPSLPFESILKRLPSNLPGIKKVEISENRTLLSDIEQSDVVMYWGTTVALEALRLGRPVIHYDMGTKLSYDPLFDFTNLKKTVTSKDSLSEVLKDIFLSDQNIVWKEQQLALNYLNDYFAPVNLENIKPFFQGALRHYDSKK